MATQYQQFENDKESIVPAEEVPPAYTPSTVQTSFPPQYLQQPVQTQTIVHVNNSVPYPNDYFGLALFVTLCCCLPFGIVALVKSSEVKTKAAMGDSAGALQASQESKNWSMAGFGTGLVLITITTILNTLLVLNGSYTYSYYG